MKYPIVYIPTRGRLDNVAKIVPKWLEKDCQVILVVRAEEVTRHKNLMRELGYNDVGVCALPMHVFGMGAIRNYIIRRLVVSEYIIMADDDVFPSRNADVLRLFDFDEIPGKPIGIGATRSFYGLTYGNEFLKSAERPLMMPGAMGKQIFSLHVPRVIGLGNFDKNLHTIFEDNEIVMRAIRDLHTPWYIHPRVGCTAIGKRYAPGGFSDLYTNPQHRLRAEFECHKHLYKKWGTRYINKPEFGKRLVVSWRKLLEDYIPNYQDLETWKARAR